MSCSSAVCRASRLCEPKLPYIKLRVDKKKKAQIWNGNIILVLGYLYVLCIHMQQLMIMLLAFSYPGWARWWWGANLKAIRPPFELHYRCWLIIALGCGATTEPASALLYSAVWYDLRVHWCEFFGLFMVPFVSQWPVRAEAMRREKKEQPERRIQSHLWGYLLVFCPHSWILHFYNTSNSSYWYYFH